MRSADLVRIQQIDPDVVVSRLGSDNRPECPGGTPAPADDLAEVIGMHPDLKSRAATQLLGNHLDIVRIVDDATD
jgi:hypothetical protein